MTLKSLDLYYRRFLQQYEINKLKKANADKLLNQILFNAKVIAETPGTFEIVSVGEYDNGPDTSCVYFPYVQQISHCNKNLEIHFTRYTEEIGMCQYIAEADYRKSYMRAFDQYCFICCRVYYHDKGVDKPLFIAACGHTFHKLCIWQRYRFNVNFKYTLKPKCCCGVNLKSISINIENPAQLIWKTHNIIICQSKLFISEISDLA